MIKEATKAIMDVYNLTLGLKNGTPPDSYSLMGLQAELVKYHTLLGLEMAQKFGAKESCYLKRKIAQAQNYQHSRSEKKTSADSERDAQLSVGEEYQREIDSMTEFEQYRQLLKSLQNSLDYSRSVLSFIKASESSPATQ